MDEFEEESAQLLSLSENRQAGKEYYEFRNKILNIRNKLKKVKIILFCFLGILSIILSIIFITKKKVSLGIIIIIINIIELILILWVSTSEYNPFDGITPLMHKGIYCLIGTMLVIFSIFFLIFLLEGKKSLIFISLSQLIIFIIELFLKKILDKIYDCIYGKKMDNLYQNYEDENSKIENDFKNLTKKYFDEKKIDIEEKGDNSKVTSIIYIDIIESLFCICDREVVCFKYPEFYRIYEYEKFFEVYIDIILYLKNKKLLFASNKHSTYICSFVNNCIMLVTKLDISIKMLVNAPYNKIIVLQFNGLCSCLDKKYQNIEYLCKEAENIQISPNKDILIISKLEKLIIKDAKSFKELKIIQKKQNCISKIYFLDKTHFIYSTEGYLHLIDIKDFSNLFEFKYHGYNMEFLKLGNTNYFILCNLTEDNYIKHPIICEYKNNYIKEIGKIYFFVLDIFSASCLKNQIFLGRHGAITSFKIKKHLFYGRIDILSNYNLKS